MLAHTSLQRKRCLRSILSVTLFLFLAGTTAGQQISNGHIGSGLTVETSATISIAQVGLITSPSDQGIISILDVTSVERIEEEPLALDESITVQFFPNPTRDVLNINSDAEKYQVRIADLQGRILKQTEDIEGLSTHDFNSYAQGTYLVYLTENQKVFKVLRIIKQ